MNIRSNKASLLEVVNSLNTNTDYTNELKNRDMERLNEIPPDNLLKELKNFQDALFQIVMQKGHGDHSAIGNYVTNDCSRMRMLVDFFKQGLFDLLYKLFTTKGVGSAYNWRNLSTDLRAPCISLALRAGKNELVDFLLEAECSQLNPNGLYTADFVNLITTMGEEGFLTADHANAFIAKIKSGAITKDEIMGAIRWKHVELQERLKINVSIGRLDSLFNHGSKSQSADRATVCADVEKDVISSYKL
jgi:hypothetical protein